MLHGYRMLDDWDAFVLVDELYVKLMLNVGVIPSWPLSFGECW
jgi:hypothetical protein